MYQLAIIGGGPGGYVAAIRGAQQGLKVLLIEKDSLGGTCLNRGCIPTKSYVYDSKLFHAARTSPVLSGSEGLSLDPVKMLSRKRQVIKTLVDGLNAIIRSNNIDILNGQGQITAPGKVSVQLKGQTRKEYETEHIIIATGSKPAIPPFIEVDGEFVQTTDEALNTEKIPRKMIIIGGGVIGVEMASIFLNLGVEVTVLELLPDILVSEDHEIRSAMRKLLIRRGAEIFFNANVKDLSISKNQIEVVFTDKTGTVKNIKTDRVLVATGRAPVIDCINTQTLELQMDGNYINVNSRMQTNLPGVYAIGDVVGGMMLAHKASADAEVAVANIVGKNITVTPGLIPRCIWGVTEIGSVGITEEAANNEKRTIKIGKFFFKRSGSAHAMVQVDGFVKIIGDKETGEILGVHILGDHATDLIGEAVTVMTMESVVEDLALAVKPHPTLSEAIMEAAMDWCDIPIHKIIK